MNVFDSKNVELNEETNACEKKETEMKNVVEELNAPEMQEFAEDMTDIRNQTIPQVRDGDDTDYEDDIPTIAVDTHEAYARQGRNKEYYRDPTYAAVRKRYKVVRPANGYSQPKTYVGTLDNRIEKRYNNGIPVYTGRKSKQYETIGIIIRLLDLAGFELAERLVLRDKETGEVLK